MYKSNYLKKDYFTFVEGFNAGLLSGLQILLNSIYQMFLYPCILQFHFYRAHFVNFLAVSMVLISSKSK